MKIFINALPEIDDSGQTINDGSSIIMRHYFNPLDAYESADYVLKYEPQCIILDVKENDRITFGQEVIAQKDKDLLDNESASIL